MHDAMHDAMRYGMRCAMRYVMHYAMHLARSVVARARSAPARRVPARRRAADLPARRRPGLSGEGEVTLALTLTLTLTRCRPTWLRSTKTSTVDGQPKEPRVRVRGRVRGRVRVWFSVKARARARVRVRSATLDEERDPVEHRPELDEHARGVLEREREEARRQVDRAEGEEQLVAGVPARSKAVESAALEAANSSTRGSGWAPSGPASLPGSAEPARAARRALRRHRVQAGALQRGNTLAMRVCSSFVSTSTKATW
eukprot:scaffold52809_cov42-Phaeocystis_antarctica.AAC.1